MLKAEIAKHFPSEKFPRYIAHALCMHMRSYPVLAFFFLFLGQRCLPADGHWQRTLAHWSHHGRNPRQNWPGEDLCPTDCPRSQRRDPAQIHSGEWHQCWDEGGGATMSGRVGEFFNYSFQKRMLWVPTWTWVGIPEQALVLRVECYRCC